MKKLLVIVSILVCMPVWAANNLQVQDEQMYIHKHSQEIIEISKADKGFLITQDYECYKKNGGSIYGVLLFLKDEIANYQNKDINLKYLNMMISGFDKYINLKELPPKINIDDKNYILLDQRIKDNIITFNLIFADNSNKFKEKIRNNFNPEESLKEINNKAIHTAIASYIQDDRIEGLGSNVGIRNLDQLLKYYNDTNKQIDNYYSKFKTEPNNIADNYHLIYLLGTSKGTYQLDIKAIENDFFASAYDVYKKSYNSQREKTDIPVVYEDEIYKYRLMNKETFIKNLRERNDLKIVNYYNKINTALPEYDAKAKEVSEYSYNLEKKQYNEWLKANGKKQYANITLPAYIYYSHTPQPVNTVLFKYNPQKGDFPLKVLQSVPGGILVSGSYQMTNCPVMNTIFIQTTKSFADGQIITEPLTVEFKGYYEYKTVLGANRKIYKFYRLGQAEIDKNFKQPNKQYYFFVP